MKNMWKWMILAAIVGVICTGELNAQIDTKRVGPIKGAVIKGGRNPAPTDRNVAKYNPVTFCWSSEQDASAKYRLKVWQLMQGQNAEAAMRSNPPIVVKDVDNLTDAVTTAKHAINTKGAGSGDRNSTVYDGSDVVRACSETLSQAIPLTQYHAINTKGAGANDRTGATETSRGELLQSFRSANSGVVAAYIENFGLCAKGGTCDFAWSVERVGADGTPTNNDTNAGIFSVIWQGNEMRVVTKR